ncbi:hypothetical protein [Terrimonas pollutisoli]|uniref:hypothetical protein n=1 Tax=Terrimonas pollutisoli TaxID=3034147 RepID=UPI0023EDA4F0|nr:hypothetical protein [Terrimonas sp. H1YJ31]
MRWMKWVGAGAALLLIIACFFTWIVVPSKNIVVSGVDATGTSFGKPGYFHLLFSFFFLLFSFIPKIWAKRTNLLVTALNLAWAMRNYFIISACRGGECPEKHVAFYLVIVASIIILVAALFPDIKIPAEKNKV